MAMATPLPPISLVINSDLASDCVAVALRGGCVAASQAPSSAEVRQHTQALFVAA